MIPRVGAVIAVRNEKERILSTLLSLSRQTIPPVLVSVVDDGSTDGTADLVAGQKGYNFRTSIVTLPPHEGSNVGRPQLAMTFNAGLQVIREFEPPVTHVLHLGSDHSLPLGYLETIIGRMNEDPKLVAASGWIVGEPFNPSAPRGSGMVVSADFWRRANGMRFPVCYGWESWVYLKALQSGMRSRAFKDVPTTVGRRTSQRKGTVLGRGMYALGYDWTYAVGRSVIYGRRSPKSGVQMFAGYLARQGLARADVADWVGKWQREMLLKRVGAVLKGGAR